MFPEHSIFLIVLQLCILRCLLQYIYLLNFFHIKWKCWDKKESISDIILFVL